jgi:S-adenosylmethionine:tRNA ribosyltransferase-isomerase
MTPARAPRRAMRLLALDTAHGRWTDGSIGDLPRHLQRGDLLVLNDAATLPASLPARTAAGEVIELRLATQEGADFWAVAFGAGGWRQRTEDREAPPAIAAGSTVFVGRSEAGSAADDLRAEVRAVSPLSPRLLRLRFAAGADELWPALYRHGRPVQYSYLAEPLALWDVQTPYHARPWAMEMPSAGRGLTLPRLDALRRAGVGLAALTHAASLSSTGDPALDAALPLPERYEVPPATVRAVERTRAAGGAVVAVGTTVVRALESAAAGGTLRAGTGTATLRIGPGFRPRVVDGLLTGVHDDGSSHLELLKAFAPVPLLERALRHAQEAGYLGHEFGDALLVRDGALRPPPAHP